MESKNNGQHGTETTVRFIKLTNQEVLIRTQRNGTTIERIAQVVPPEAEVKEPRRT
jgi:hypothetical protein